MSALGYDFNWWMQHLDSEYEEGDVADEAETKDLLQRRTESPARLALSLSEREEISRGVVAGLNTY